MTASVTVWTEATSHHSAIWVQSYLLTHTRLLVQSKNVVQKIGLQIGRNMGIFKLAQAKIDLARVKIY